MKLEVNMENQYEKLLAALPKDCGCHVCQLTKQEAKKSLGEKKFNALCKQLGIVV